MREARQTLYLLLSFFNSGTEDEGITSAVVKRSTEPAFPCKQTTKEKKNSSSLK